MNALNYKHALVTGASSGIGLEYAKRFAAMGIALTLVARHKQRLETLATELRASNQIEVTVLVADLTNSTDLSQLEQYVAGAANVDLLINNAGAAVYKPVVDTDMAALDMMVALNITSLVHLTRAALPNMIAHQHGAIINVGAGLAFRPGAMRATYSGTKAFMVNFVRSIQEEVEGSGVQMQLLVPGLIRTEFHEHSGTDITRFPPEMIMSPDDLVQGSLLGLERRELICIPALPDTQDLETFLTAQLALGQNLAHQGQLAARYAT